MKRKIDIRSVNRIYIAQASLVKLLLKSGVLLSGPGEGVLPVVKMSRVYEIGVEHVVGKGMRQLQPDTSKRI